MAADNYKTVLLTGGTGFIGRKLCDLLLNQGHSVLCLSRQKNHPKCSNSKRFKLINTLDELDHLTPPDWVINLAGAPILDRPWTRKRKVLLRQSRITLTVELVNKLAHFERAPEVMISGSAIGYYGDTHNTIVDEHAPAAQDFAAQLCNDWEQAAQAVTSLGTRLCLLRTSIVLGPNGGILARMLLPFKLGLGGKLGSGQQWMSWISLDDICRLILFLAEKPYCSGPFNACTASSVTNAEFTQTLGRLVHRPTFFTMPAFILKVLLGDASSLLLSNQQVTPQKASEAGFSFQDNKLDVALKRCLIKQD